LCWTFWSLAAWGLEGEGTTYSGKDVEGSDDVERLEPREENLEEVDVGQVRRSTNGERGTSTIPMERCGTFH